MTRRKRTEPNSATPGDKPARGLVCPGCHGRAFEVLYAVDTPGGKRRVRRCIHCKRRLSTFERINGGEPDRRRARSLYEYFCPTEPR